MNALPSLIGVAATIALLVFVAWVAEAGISHLTASMHLAGV